MCGIVGIIAKKRLGGFQWQDRDSFGEMLHMDALRGEDSTGMYVVNKWGNMEWCKEAHTPAMKFLDQREPTSIMGHLSFDGVLGVGHNRKATLGQVTDENAHPHMEENIILVHNGTLREHKKLKDVEVDSHALAHAIAENGIEEALKITQGAFSLGVYDIFSRKFFLVRNKERPMWIAETERIYLFASEPWMIYGAAWRNSLKLTEDAAPTKDGVLYTFDLSQDVIKAEEQEVEFYSPPKAVVYHIPSPPKTSTTAATTGSATKRRKTYPGKKASEFELGDRICFIPEHFYCNGDIAQDHARIHGRHYWEENVRISARVDPTLFYGEVEDLSKKPLLVGTVNALIKDQHGKVTRMEIIDADESYTESTWSGDELNEEMLDNFPTECSQCHADLDLNYVGFYHINQKSRVRINCICDECVTKNIRKHGSKWGKKRNAKQVQSSAV